MNYQMGKNEVVSFVAAAGDQVLQVVEGVIWLTRAGDSRDYFLRPPGRFLVRRSDSVIVEAVSAASFSLVTVSAPARARVVIHCPGALPHKA